MFKINLKNNINKTLIIGTTAIVLFSGWGVYPGMGAMMIWSRDFPSLPTLGAASQYNFYSIIPYGILNYVGLHSVNSVLLIAGLGLVSLLIFVASFSLNN